jgi:hypothetical protein
MNAQQTRDRIAAARERLEAANLVRHARNMLGSSHVQANAHRLGVLGAGDIRSALACLDEAIKKLPDK